MALVVPLASSASVIENILFKVRRGIALSRNASQADPTTGVMVDLPEKIDFEMTLLKTHQGLSRNIETMSNDSSSEAVFSSDVDVTSVGKSSFDSKSTNSGSSKQEVGNTYNRQISDTGNSELNSDAGFLSGAEGSSSAESSNSAASNTSVDADNGSSNETSSSAIDEGSSNTEVTTSSGNGNDTDTTSVSSSETEARCTDQNHSASRVYDKFDTDTGEIIGL